MVGYVPCTVHYSVDLSSVFIVGLFVVRCTGRVPLQCRQSGLIACSWIRMHTHTHREGEKFNKTEKAEFVTTLLLPLSPTTAVTVHAAEDPLKLNPPAAAEIRREEDEEICVNWGQMQLT